MSHYTSGRYYLERQRRQNIENQCRRELQDAQQRAAANQRAFKAMLEQRKQTEAARAAQERALRDEATAGAVHFAAQKLERTRNARALLARCEEQIRDCERGLMADGSLRRRMETLRAGLDLYGGTDEVLRKIEAFGTEELPAERERLRRIQNEKRAAAQAAVSVAVPVRDQSTDFVSLQKRQADGAGARVTPWERFVRRVEALAALQEEMGETEAATLLQQLRAAAPAMRNRLLLQHEARVAQMEAEAETLRQIETERDARDAQEYTDYLAVCSLCGETPTLDENRPAAELRAEREHLWTAYLQRQEQQYITNAFSEVFAEYGIQFESMVFDEQGRLQMEYSIDQHTGVQISRSASGAFEMEFSGTTDAAVASQDERRQVVEKAHSFCSLLPKLSAGLKARGILFDQVLLQEPTEETVRIGHSGASARREARSLRQMTL